MSTNKLRGAVVALALSLAMPAVAQDVTARTVIATVGGYEITVGHLLVARQTLPEQYQQLPNSVLLPGLVEQLVQQVALSQAVGDTLTLQEQIGLSNQTTGYRAGVALNRAADTAVTDEALQAAYAAAYADAAPEEEFNASHILVETQEEAIAVRDMLAGGADFAETARQKSTGPSGPNGGELGWFGKGMMVPEFEAAVVALTSGQISDPVETQFGWHVIKLNETRNATTPTLDEVRETLAEQLRAAAVTKAIEDTVAAVEVVQTDIQLDPEILNQFNLLTE